jgi:hypothetical protein
MKSVAVVLALLGSAAAFAPVAPRALKAARPLRAEEEAAAAEAAPAEEEEAPAPPPPPPKMMTGGEYLKTMSGGDGPETGGKIPATAMWIADFGTPATMDFFRASEIKHGRIAMFAFGGWCAAVAGIHFPGMLSISEGISFADVAAQNPVDAFFNLPAASTGQIFGFVSALEWFDMTHKNNEFVQAGNNVLKGGSFKPYQNPIDPWGLMKKSTEKQLEENKLKELKNGRLAMWGVLSMTCAATIPGSVPPLAGLF